LAGPASVKICNARPLVAVDWALGAPTSAKICAVGLCSGRFAARAVAQCR
jgi:hypothetical protein